jgi:hypothetical protein
MKKFQSLVEGTWVEIFNVELTSAEQELLMSQNENDKNSQKDLINRVKSARESTVTNTLSDALHQFYLSKKPVLKDGDVYQFIAIDLFESDNNYTGILNCRINEEHQQIRF